MNSAALQRTAVSVLVVLAVPLALLAVPDQPQPVAAGRTMPVLAQEKQEPAGDPGQAEKTMSPRDLLLMRGEIYMARKMYTEAVAVYQELLRKEPRSAELLNRIGVAYHHQSELGQAQKYYKRALKADKTYTAAINNLGMVNYDRRKYKQAVNDFRKALKLNPGLSATERNLGHAYFALKKYDEALAAFHRALALDPLVFERKGARAGSVLQGVPVEQRGMYFFFLAKSYALMNNAERCAEYLRKAQAEGFQGVSGVAKDPAFAGVIDDPLVQEALQPRLPVASNPKPQ